MTIAEMLHQVALLTGADFLREGPRAMITIHLPGGRVQRISGQLTNVRGEAAGLLYTEVGVWNDAVDTRALLELNATLRHARIALFEPARIIVFAIFDLEQISVRECAPMLQEIGAVADELERRFFGEDAH